MNNINRKAISEVIEILNHIDVSITEKIPEEFKRFLLENTDETYIPNIIFENSNWENTIEDDTKAMLALIYRDYIASEEEKKEIIEQEEAIRKSNSFSFINNKKDKKNVLSSSMQLIEVKEKPWYKKIIQVILRLLAIDNKKTAKGL